MEVQRSQSDSENEDIGSICTTQESDLPSSNDSPSDASHEEPPRKRMKTDRNNSTDTIAERVKSSYIG